VAQQRDDNGHSLAICATRISEEQVHVKRRAAKAEPR